ncbi:ethanolamine ammonia-lyase subunit EutC [Robbsia andropogonis]|uniref:ethanolamine ammonia-lyase subunit EutC n=1 Tax=Robbsia andropogonis TaxID=28092 RepID=UPI00209EF481|nr:ethanolamine ammonia-lyase subunit EutC [Robbsia andropogonis]MCP1121562.1 ethanolamine ammonia-lyase subunit EutC [Robbsia andropogonis]MCP1131377.1 ethanolamine ammonia-lyase subunit EutC [Robbsia andropogonis]
MRDKPTLQSNPWDALRQFTGARIALGRAGNSMPTTPLLEFNLAHAQARDAVHQPLDVSSLLQALQSAGFEALRVRSAAKDRLEYLRRPDLGRRLADDSAEQLRACAAEAAVSERGRDGEAAPRWDVVFVVADGLSSQAADRHAVPLLQCVRKRLTDWRIAPVVVATQSRVALGDDVGELLHARLVVMLIGERPGLSSPDSLGLYLTHAPRRGTSDAQRNCISNVRPEGLGYDAAAFKLCHLLTEARRLKLTGVQLKDDSDALLTRIADPGALPAPTSD